LFEQIHATGAKSYAIQAVYWSRRPSVLLLQAGAVSWRLIALMLSENPFGPKV
jgi:hypothetical protein